MPNATIRDATTSDFAAICALNSVDAIQTSPMGLERLSELNQLASYHKVACVEGCVAAFLLAMGSDAPYENDNFSWFFGKFPSFIYVDRIVVSSSFRSLGLASLLYEELFRFARGRSIQQITCEYNIFPPNEPSRLFHDKFGFRQQGTQWLANGTKQVSLQAARV